MNRFIRLFIMGALLAAVAPWWSGTAVAAPDAEDITDARAYLAQAWDRTLRQTQSAKSKFSMVLESPMLDTAVIGEAAICGGPNYTMKVAGQYAAQPIFCGGPFERKVEAYFVRGGSDWTVYKELYGGKWRRTTAAISDGTPALMRFAYRAEPEALPNLIAWAAAIASEHMGSVRTARQDDRTAVFQVTLDMQSLRDLALEGASAEMDKSPRSEQNRRRTLRAIHMIFDQMDDIRYNVEVDKQSGRIARFYADLAAPARAAFVTLIQEAAGATKKDRDFLELITGDSKLLISAELYSVNRVEPFEVPREIVEQAAK